MGSDYLTLKQAAEYLGVSRAKLSRLSSEGTIAYLTSPLDKRLKLFKREDIEKLRQQPLPTREAS